MRLNQLDGLIAFWKVAQHRGFTAAAAALEVSPSALSQAIRHLEADSASRLLNRTTRSVSLTEAGEAYLSRIGPALGEVLDAGEQLHALQGRPSGGCASTRRVSRSRWCCSRCWPDSSGPTRSTDRADQRRRLRRHRRTRLRRGRSSGRKRSERHGRRAARRSDLRGDRRITRILQATPRPRHPSDLVHHNCVRFRFSGSGAIHKWELEVGDRMVEYEISGNLTISDYVFRSKPRSRGWASLHIRAALASPHSSQAAEARVDEFSPTFPGFYLYYPSRRQQPSKLKVFVDYALVHWRTR